MLTIDVRITNTALEKNSHKIANTHDRYGTRASEKFKGKSGILYYNIAKKDNRLRIIGPLQVTNNKTTITSYS